MTCSEFCRRFALLRVAALALWIAGVLWLSLSSSPPRPPEALSWDKLRHAAAYALMTLLAGRVFVLYCASPLRGWIWGTVFAVVFGGLIEIAQGTLSEVRSAEFADMAANVCGALAALGAALIWRAIFRQRKT